MSTAAQGRFYAARLVGPAVLAPSGGAVATVRAGGVDADPAWPALTAQAGEAVGRGQAVLAEMMVARGMTTTAADRLALQSLCILEGAVAVSRARREIAPLDEAADAIRALYEAEVGPAGAATGGG